VVGEQHGVTQRNTSCSRHARELLRCGFGGCSLVKSRALHLSLRD
jgi:hypothetical protein